MMEASQHGTDAGRDTTMCGDPKAWYPMRVTYSREMKVKAQLCGFVRNKYSKENQEAIINIEVL